MGLLTKSAILSAEDFEYAVVSCPEWGGDIRVRGLTAADQQYIAKLSNTDHKDEMAIAVFMRGVVDENGSRIFTDSRDKDELRQKSYAVIERVTKKIVELTGRSDTEGIEEQRKN